MPRNYNSVAIGDSYVRAPLVEIRYPGPMTAHVRIIEAEAVKMKDGTVRELVAQLGQLEWTVGPADMGQVLQLVDPDTGADIPGATMTNQQLMLGLLAAIRARQKLADAQQDAPQPAPAPAPSPTAPE